MSGYKKMSVALVFAFAVGVWSSVVRTMGPQSEEVESFNEHMARVRKFRCSVPQPRSIVSRDLIENFYTQEYVMPSMTVIHRCDGGAGCCLQSEQLTCAEDRTEVVTLDFKIGNEFDKSERHLTVSVVNHTSCACKNIYESKREGVVAVL